jgi:hypothetical protein
MRLAVLTVGVLIVLIASGTVLAQDAAAPDSAINSGLITGLRHLHSALRWLVVIVTIAALVKLLVGLVQRVSYDALSHRLMIAFSGLTTVQWVVGLVFLLVYGGVVGFGVRYFWEHAAIMTVAVGLSHMHMRFRNAEAPIRYRNNLILVGVVLALVIVGVALLPQGWRLFPTMA